MKNTNNNNVAPIKNVTMGTEAWDEILNEYSEAFELDNSPIVLKADSAMNPIIKEVAENTNLVVVRIEKILSGKKLTKTCPKCEGGVWNARTCRFCGGTDKVVSKWGKVEKKLQSYKKLINLDVLPVGYTQDMVNKVKTDLETTFKSIV